MSTFYRRFPADRYYQIRCLQKVLRLSGVWFIFIICVFLCVKHFHVPLLNIIVKSAIFKSIPSQNFWLLGLCIRYHHLGLHTQSSPLSCSIRLTACECSQFRRLYRCVQTLPSHNAQDHGSAALHKSAYVLGVHQILPERSS